VHQVAGLFGFRFCFGFSISPLVRPVKPASFLCYHGLISVRIREVPFHLLRYWVLRRARHQASVRSSRSARVLASSAARAQAARFLQFFTARAQAACFLRFFSARLTLDPCRPSCLDSFFLSHLIWCMLLICFYLALRIHASSSEQSTLSTDFPHCFLLSPTEI
jgi:hypothetical protein